VTVERIKLHVRDNNGTRAASAMLYRSNPPSGSAILLGTVASPPGVVGHLQTYTSDPIDKVVWPSQKAILWITIGGQSISVYGVTVEYHRNI
jgi:hypothetical protein